MIYGNQLHLMSMLKDLCDASIVVLEDLWERLKEANELNEQYVLDWLDKINEISIRN
jgi:hypothetical protein